MAQAFMDLEQLAELTSRLVLENSAWSAFVDTVVEKIFARHDVTEIDKLIETMQKFVRQEITYKECISQVDQPIAEILNEAVSVYKRVCHKETPEKRVSRVILKKPTKPTKLALAYATQTKLTLRSNLCFREKEPKALRTTTKGTQRVRRPAKLWTPEESEMLRSIMAQQHIEKIEWTAVATQLGTGRTSAQCAQHWYRVLNPDLQKNDWRIGTYVGWMPSLDTDSAHIDEDGDLLDLYEVHQTKWSVIASLIKGRSDTQCRNRYLKLKTALKEHWFETEDALLFTYREQKMSWEQISERLTTVSQTKNTHCRYPIVCKMRYTTLTGIDTDYEEIGIGTRNRAAQPDVEMSTSDVPLNKC